MGVFLIVAVGEIPSDVVEGHLERVLASAGFVGNERLSRFLRFIVQQELNGRGSELKESLIGIEVFGRRPGFDPKHDSTVRSEAARLRARLAEYYDDEGKGKRDTLVIEVPKGGYVPRFHRSEPPLAQENSGHARRLQPWQKALAAGLALALAAVGFWLWNRGTGPISIAVLPLTNLSSDAANDYFADGISDEIIRDLSIVDGLAVRSQTSSFALKGKAHNVREIGRQLDADYILEGSVLRAGQQLRINARLIRVRDDFPLWSGRYDRELTDIFAIQDEVARGVVNGLRLKLGRGRRRYETSVEAYDLYLRARASGAQRFPGDDEVIGLFEKAIVKDASFAPAYAGLAGAETWRSFERPNNPNRANELQSIRAAADKAIELDPLLAEAHSALGAAYASIGQWEQAEQSFRRAVEIAPNLSSAHESLARFFLWPLGRIEEAVRELRAAERSDPLSGQVLYGLASALLSAGRFDEAASQCEKIPSDNVYKNECLGRARVAQGKPDEAFAVLAVSATNNWGYLANAYARAGRQAEAEKLMAEAPALYPQRRGHSQFALAYAGFGDRDHTIEELEQLAAVGPVRIGYMTNSREFAFVRGDPRVKALRKKVGLPE
jgi:TolB-like protein/Tfp pilus assembly protein PilF